MKHINVKMNIGRWVLSIIAVGVGVIIANQITQIYWLKILIWTVSGMIVYFFFYYLDERKVKGD